MSEQLTRPPSTAARRANAVAGVLANAVLLVLVHVWPGWDVVPFLTDDMALVLPFVDAALVAGIVVALVQLVRPEGWLAPAGTLVTTAFGLVATVRVLQVFPFDLSTGWETVVRIVLWIGIVGAVIGLLAALVSLVRLRTFGQR
ncbi:hypothetical protein ACI797_05495 [Geodermatophilus sp. SYSU D00691]